MQPAKIHFDVSALLAQVRQQDIGLRVSTNDPAGFKRIVYSYIRANPSERVFIYTAAGTKNSLFLLNDPHLAQESSDGETASSS